MRRLPLLFAAILICASVVFYIASYHITTRVINKTGVFKVTKTAVSFNITKTNRKRSTAPSPGEVKMLREAKRRAHEFSWAVNVTNTQPAEVHHVVFVKVHKAASTTVFNVLLRVCISRDLNVLFPRDGSHLSLFEQSMFPLLAHPPSPPFHFDVLLNHVVLNLPAIDKYFPPDTQYVAILREPWQQLRSAYKCFKYRGKAAYLQDFPHFEKYIQNQSQYETMSAIKSLTNNRMSIDLGLPPKYVTNSSYISTFISHLDSKFNLVLISERFDESMVLLKRSFHWTMKDIVYRKLYADNGKVKIMTQPDPDLLKKIREFERFDVAVYEHFAEVFDRRIAAEGNDFKEELRLFMDINLQVSLFCDDTNVATSLVIPRSTWNQQFIFKRSECAILSAEELTVNSWAKQRQLQRLAPLLFGP